MSLTQPARPLTCDHGLRRDAIVSSLLGEVFQGRLRAGQHLVTRELALRFGVSHTPIREALIALAGTGVIDLSPNKGAVVRSVTAKDVREVCEVRRLLECEAVRLACGRIEPRELESLRVDLKRQEDDACSARRADFIDNARSLDSSLHDRIALSCGNSLLAKELSRLKTLFRAFRDVAWEQDESQNDSRRLAEESREHLAIVEGLAINDSREASRAMSLHIMNCAKYWCRVLQDGPARSAPHGSAASKVRGSEPSR